MSRKPTGQIIEPRGKQRSWALRFSAYGKRQYLTLGTPEEGWTRKRAEKELGHVLADVERGTWKPPQRTAPAPSGLESFDEFAAEWLAGRRYELRQRTVDDYEWALDYHLLPFFGELTLGEITVIEVDRYKARKLREGRLGGAQINKTRKLLAQILDVAIEYE